MINIINETSKKNMILDDLENFDCFLFNGSLYIKLDDYYFQDYYDTYVHSVFNMTTLNGEELAEDTIIDKKVNIDIIIKDA